MNELDEVWAQKLNEAINQAHSDGRSDVADYLALKASNDALRSTGVKWLFDALLEIASFANRNNSSITIENDNPHQFTFGNANLVGSVLRFRQGVRCLTLEAGWTRTPTDGFMRGGALACAKLTHFGIGKHNAELLLVHSNSLLNWVSIDKNGGKNTFDSHHLNQHFQIFAGEI
ncbi:MAG: hypothetical protein ACR2MG_12675 [Pyrinomonadaceae bacterium]